MVDQVLALSTTQNPFARLVEEYHEVNRAIQRLETRAEPLCPSRDAALKRRRLELKSEIDGVLGRAAA